MWLHLYLFIYRSNYQFGAIIIMGPAGPMLCSSQASGSPFWNKLTFQVTWLLMTRHPLHLYVGVWGLITDMHLPNYYQTGWINLLDVKSSPSKYSPMSIYQVGVTSVCYVYKKNSYLDDSAHQFFYDSAHEFQMFDDSTHEYCIHPRRLSVLTDYLSLSLTHFTPIHLANHFI